MKRYGGPSEMNSICGSHNLTQKFTVLPEKKSPNLYKLAEEYCLEVPKFIEKINGNGIKIGSTSDIIIFIVECQFQGLCCTAEAGTKKSAKNMAAKAVIKKLQLY